MRSGSPCFSADVRWGTPHLELVSIVAGAALVVLLIGASRVCLGVHYTTDVVAGFSAGVMWLAASVAGVGTYWRQEMPRVTGTRPVRTPPPAPRDPGV